MALNFMAFQTPHARARVFDDPIREIAEDLLAMKEHVHCRDTAISLSPIIVTPVPDMI